MAVIAKVSNSKSAHASLSYGLGKGVQKLKNDTREWLESNGVDTSQITGRAVVSSGTNGIVPEMADMQFKATRQAFNQDKASNQVLRVIQSFADYELSALSPDDWQTANDLGVRMAEELYPDHQSAVYTHIDGENHTLHNHIIVNKVNLETGKKMREKPGETVKRAREINDNLAKERGWAIVEKPADNVTKVEKDLGTDSWRWKLKLKINVMLRPDATFKDWDGFKEWAKVMGVDVIERGKTVTYAFKDDTGTERKVRASKLGTDYEKETIVNELERRNRPTESNGLETTSREIEQREQQADLREQSAEQREQRVDGAIRTTNSLAERLGNKVQQLTDRLRELGTTIRQLIERATQAAARPDEAKPEQRPDSTPVDPEPVRAVETELLPLLDTRDVATIFRNLDKATFAQVKLVQGGIDKQVEREQSQVKIDLEKPITAETINELGRQLSEITDYSVEDLAILANRGHQFSPLDSVKNPVKQNSERSFNQSKSQTNGFRPRM